MPEISYYRRRIDELDRKIVELLEERVAASRKIGKLKKAEGKPVDDPEREEEVLEKVSSVAKSDKRFVAGLYRSIIEYCKNEQR